MLALDKHRNTVKERRSFIESRRAELTYATNLRKIGRQVGDLVNSLDQEAANFANEVTRILSRYAELIQPWARAVATRMISEVSRRDEQVWKDIGRDMGRALRMEIQSAPTGALLQQKLAENVGLITSLPLEAAQRVHKLTLEKRSNSARSKDIAKEIMATGHVTQSRATLIARTEVARTGSALTEARALHVGSEAYIWRTARDSDVRKSHKEMEGKLVRWDSPPTLSDGTTTHAGQIYNCRCYAEVVIPDNFD